MLDHLFTELDKYKDLAIYEDRMEFDKLVGQIAETGDPTAIPRLLEYFDDDSDWDELMYSLVHAIEDLGTDDTVYLTYLMPSLPQAWDHSPEWVKVLHYRIFNAPDTFAVYQRYLKRMNQQTRDIIREIIIDIRDEEEEFYTQCEVLLKELT